MIKKFGSFFTLLFTLIFLAIFAGSIGIFYVIFYYSNDLPDYKQLTNYSPPTITRLYASDGKLVEEYAKEKRLFVPIQAIPKKIVYAFIAAEDQNFYHHPGIDFSSIFRAGVQNIINASQNKSLVGGSTITQQVVKNFLLTNERSLSRKIKEAILAFRITQAFSKDRIMELYLNQIYLGNRSYGVAAAALNYFNKSMAELSIEEAALLAAMPKAPSSLDPVKFPKRAKERRDWVIKRMEEEGYINEAAAVLALSRPIKISTRDETEIVSNGGYFAESVRRMIEDQYGEKTLYEEGLSVNTTLDPKLQTAADKALKKGLIAYDHRHGYRGPIKKIKISDKWMDELKKVPSHNLINNWYIAVVLGFKDNSAIIGFQNGKKGLLPFKNMSWAATSRSSSASSILPEGSVIIVSKNSDSGFNLEQVPKVNGAVVAMDPYTGKVLAMSGGFNYGSDQFNRAIQAMRQPGSSFKPFVYLAAMENGYAPNSIIIDEKIQLDMGENMPGWTPQNYSGDYYGPTTLRKGLEKSRNAMTVRLSQLMGIDKVVEVAERFQINPNPEANFSVALGTSETTLLRLVNAYSMLVNGGKKVTPVMVDRIQDRTGKTIYKSDKRICDKCTVNISKDAQIDNNFVPPSVEDNRESIADPVATYQVVSMLEGVVQRGTGVMARSLGYTLAGKTGTTNKSFDAWFIGFSYNLVVGVYVGFDNPQSLGGSETGASAALPIWIDVMRDALQGKPDIPFRRPPGVKMVKIDAETGLLPGPDTPRDKIIFEAFRAGEEPTTSHEVISPESSDDDNSSGFNGGGIY